LFYFFGGNDWDLERAVCPMNKIKCCILLYYTRRLVTKFVHHSNQTTGMIFSRQLKKQTDVIKMWENSYKNGALSQYIYAWLRSCW